MELTDVGRNDWGLCVELVFELGAASLDELAGGAGAEGEFCCALRHVDRESVINSATQIRTYFPFELFQAGHPIMQEEERKRIMKWRLRSCT